MHKCAVVALAAAMAIGGCGAVEPLSPSGARMAVAASQEAPAAIDGPLTLSAAIDIAMRRSHSLRVARADRGVAAAQVTEARSAALPGVNLRGMYTRLDEVPSFEVAPGVTMDLGELDNYSAALTVQQPIYLGGRVRAAMRAAAINERAVERGIESAEQNTVFMVHERFHRVLLSEVEAMTAEEALALAERHAEEASRRLEQGMATRFELTRAETRVAMARTGLIAARNALSRARANLFSMLALPPDAGIALEGSLEFVPAEGSDKVALLDVALRLRPDLARHDRVIEMQRERLTMVAADRLPSLVASGEVGIEKPGQGLGSSESDDYWRASIVLNLPVFDGQRTSARLTQERARLSQLEAAREQIVDQIRLEIEQAMLGLADAATLVEAQQKALGTAAEALRLAQVSYEQGVAIQIDVMDAQTALTETRRALAQAVFAHTISRAALERAVGTISTTFEEVSR